MLKEKWTEAELSKKSRSRSNSSYSSNATIDYESLISMVPPELGMGKQSLKTSKSEDVLPKNKMDLHYSNWSDLLVRIQKSAVVLKRF